MPSYALDAEVRLAPAKGGFRVTLPKWLYNMMNARIHHAGGRRWLNFKRTGNGFRAWLTVEPDPSADFYAKQRGKATFYLPRALAEAYGLSEGVYKAEARLGDGVEVYINKE